MKWLRRLWPQSIIWRLVLVLGCGLLGSHVISITIYSRERIEGNLLLGSQQLIERSVNIVGLLEDVHPELWQQLVASSQQPGYRLGLAPQPWSSVRDDKSWQHWRVRLLREYLEDAIEDADDAAGRDDYQRGQYIGLFGGGDGRWSEPRRDERRDHRRKHHRDFFDYWLRISIQLDNGTWLNVSSNLMRPPRIWSDGALGALGLMALVVLALIIWLLRMLLQPLQAFANAATELGRDYRAPPMRVQGPREVQRSIVAFNDMQVRLRQLIEDRLKMLAAVSHDLRTPITSLRLRAELIEDSEEKRKNLATLDQMEKMIESILTFAKSELATEARRVVDLSALLESIASDKQDLGMAVQFSGEHGVKLSCAPMAMQRALTNLIDNAVKYGGCARLSLREQAGKISLSIEDDGPGIPEAKHAEVFLPFARLSREREVDSGGGLGLSIAQTIIQAHGGSIKLKNLPQGGLRVLVEF